MTAVLDVGISHSMSRCRARRLSFAPGATNINAEDCAFMLESMGSRRY